MILPATPAAVLTLEDGRIFRGRSVGAPGKAVGEVVFTTCMSGYQEVISDPSYAGQIINFTYPLIGNVGVNTVDDEAPVPHCRGLIMRRLSPRSSNHRSQGTLGEWLVRHGLVAVAGIDTRALTRHIRSQGAMRGVLATSTTVETHDISQLVEEARSAPPMSGSDLTGQVTCRAPHRFTGTGAAKQLEPIAPGTDPFAGAAGPRVLVLDFGVKHGILECLVATGASVVVAPARTAPEEILALRPDGIVLSNGPGDPAAVGYGIETVRELLGRLPILGICLGHQLLALALGLETRKLPFGHHGANHPVRDRVSGRVLVTSQNHGFAVDRVPGEREDEIHVTHESLYDGTIEGIATPSRRARSIQFHPEASPGPHDARSILESFIHDLTGSTDQIERTGLPACRRATTSSAS